MEQDASKQLASYHHSHLLVDVLFEIFAASPLVFAIEYGILFGNKFFHPWGQSDSVEGSPCEPHQEAAKRPPTHVPTKRSTCL